MISSAVYSHFDTNKVLRNAFMLIALSMIPTIFGVFFGEASGFNELIKQSPGIGFIVTLVVMVGVIFAVSAVASTPIGPFAMLGFAFLIGMVLSAGIYSVLAKSSGQLIIVQSLIGTLAITFSCSVYAMVTKRDFTNIGGILFTILIGLVVVSILNVFVFKLGMLQLVISCIAVVLFSVYIIYDVQRVVSGGETNYVMAAMSIYLNIVNIFSSLLNIFSAFSDD